MTHPKPSNDTTGLRERLESKITKTNDCWNWNGSTNSRGYGQIVVARKIKKAHRVSYELHKGAIPVGLEIDHLCRNKGCVNPEHLETVTHSENILRSNQKGRSKPKRKFNKVGPCRYCSKITLPGHWYCSNNCKNVYFEKRQLVKQGELNGTE